MKEVLQMLIAITLVGVGYYGAMLVEWLIKYFRK